MTRNPSESEQRATEVQHKLLAFAAEEFERRPTLRSLTNITLKDLQELRRHLKSPTR